MFRWNLTKYKPVPFNSGAKKTFVVAACLLAGSLLGPARAQAQNLLTNPGWESTGGWGYNNWGGSSWSWATETANPHSGVKAQIVNMTAFPSGAGFIYKQDYTLAAGKLYEFSIWLRTTSACRVQVFLRTPGSTPYVVAQRTVDLNISDNPGWQKVTIRGGSQTTQSFYCGVNFLSTGNLIVDDASLTDVTATSLHGTGTPATTAVIPAEYFGVHFNKGHYNVWPAMNQGLVRMWDSGTMWKNIEPTNDGWDWTRADMYVNTLIRGHDPNCKILFTLGQTPVWAAANPTVPSGYGAGASSAPADMNEWREYVRAVATRYAGKIQYYELWNESNVTGASAFYTGGIPKMVEMAQAAKQEIQAVDPAAKLIGPNVTVSGLGFLESFLEAGGDAYVDLYSIHIYTSLLPEDALISLTNIRELLASYGITKPVLDTEGRAAGSTTPTATQSRAAVARNYVTKWGFGATNFSWYAYDINSNTNDVWLSVAENSATLNDGGIAYREIARWMTGAQMTSKNKDANGLWIVTLTRPNGYVAHICWKYTSGVTMTVPAGWGAIRRRNLDGTSSSMAGLTSTFIGNEPVLLENGTAF